MLQTGYAYIHSAVIIYCDGTKNCLSYMTYLLQKYIAANSELRHHRTSGFRKMAPHADTIKKSLIIDTKETCSTERVFYNILYHKNRIVA